MQADLTWGQFFISIFLIVLFIFAVGIHPLMLDYLDERKKKKLDELEQLKKND